MNSAASIPPSGPGTIPSSLGEADGMLAAGIYRLWIPGPLPSMNDIIEARMIRRGKWNAYTDMKKQWTGLVALLAQRARLPRFDRVHATYLIYEPNMKRDPSNVVSGAVKFIEDGLQLAKVIGNDGWNHIASIRAQWFLDKRNPGVALILSHKPEDIIDLFKLDRQAQARG